MTPLWALMDKQGMEDRELNKKGFCNTNALSFNFINSIISFDIN